MVPHAVCEIVSADRNETITACWEDDEQFKEEASVLIADFFRRYEEYFAFGSRGSEVESYFNRYSGYITWIDENSMIQIAIGRKENSGMELRISYMPDSLESSYGIVDEVTDFSVRMTETDSGETFWLYWDYHGAYGRDTVYMYPDEIEGLEAGKRIQIFYLKDMSGFGMGDMGKTCCIKALSIME